MILMTLWGGGGGARGHNNPLFKPARASHHSSGTSRRLRLRLDLPPPLHKPIELFSPADRKRERNFIASSITRTSSLHLYEGGTVVWTQEPFSVWYAADGPYINKRFCRPRHAVALTAPFLPGIVKLLTCDGFLPPAQIVQARFLSDHRPADRGLARFLWRTPITAFLIRQL
ncbi:hypothetical protein J6590_016940 [Homalodisca vitripennis]|nr:hypothetical protein J6590_016940 [Homalodisca vitripennis]